MKLYLRFYGEVAQDWASHEVPNVPAYDIDGDASTFSDAELANITDIWSRVAEKFSPFNVDVTTVDPLVLNDRQSLKAVIGGDNNWLGKPAGGVSKLGAFTNDEPNVVWVWPSSLLFDNKDIAEATAHEFGHTLGLQHHSTETISSGGNSIVDEEYAGGSGNTAPIMGNSYDSERGLWDFGTWSYRDSDKRLQLGNGAEDDLAIITSANNGFGYRSDDHGNFIGTSNSMAAPNVNLRTAAGIIEQPGDIDFFSFNTTGGTAAIHANVAGLGPMLHLQAQIYNSSGVPIASSATADLSQNFTVTGLTNGTYYVGIHGFRGANQLPWDIGQYTVSVDLNQQVDNTLATAVRVPNGLFDFLQGNSSLSEYVGAADLDDFYKFTTTGATASFKAALTGLSGDADLYLIRDYNNNFQIDTSDVIAASLNGGTVDDKVGYTGDVPLSPFTTYYVQIHRFSGDTNYTLNMSTDYAGSSLTTARFLGEFGGKQDYYDYVDSSDTADLYRLNFVGDTGPFSLAKLTIHMDQMTSDADVELISDANGNALVDVGEVIAISNHGGTTAEHISLGLDEGIYFIRVTQFSGNTNYHLSVEADYAGVGLNSVRYVDASGLSSLTDYVGATDAADAYFLAALAGKLSVQQNGPHTLQLVHDLNLNSVIDPGEVVAAGQSFTYNIPADDGYFLIVKPAGGDVPTDGNYTLTVYHDLNTSGTPSPGNAPNVGIPGTAGREIPGFVGRPNSRQSNLYHPDDFVKIHITTTQYVYATVAGMTDGDADLDLVQDVNGNGQIDPGEVIASSQSSYVQSEFIGKILAPGDYLFHVYAATADGSLPSKGNQTNYTLRIANAKVGDANFDGFVDGADYTVWADNFLKSNRFGPSQGDFSLNGIVDGADYTFWADNFAPAASPAAVALPIGANNPVTMSSTDLTGDVFEFLSPMEGIVRTAGYVVSATSASTSTIAIPLPASVSITFSGLGGSGRIQHQLSNAALMRMPTVLRAEPVDRLRARNSAIEFGSLAAVDEVFGKLERWERDLSRAVGARRNFCML